MPIVHWPPTTRPPYYGTIESFLPTDHSPPECRPVQGWTGAFGRMVRAWCIMNGTVNGPGTPRNLWRRLGELVARRMQNLRRLLSRGEHSEGSSGTGDHEAEVFPWMEHAIIAGAIFGAIAAIGLGRACDFGLSGLVLGGLLGSAAGALGGACVAVTWAVQMPTHPAAQQDLWDPWIDSGDPVRAV